MGGARACRTQEVDAAFAAACDDDTVGAIVLCGAGENFCSGHDLGSAEHVADLAADPYEAGVRGDYKKWSTLDAEACLRWRSLPKPIVAAVQGFCIYHGCAVASSADLIIAADDAKFMPSLVEATFLPWDVHPRKAKEIMMLQRFVLAEEAESIGLVNRVVPAADLQREAMAAAVQLAAGDAFHVQMMKLACNQAQDGVTLTAGVRSTLSHWTAYRSAALDPGSRAVGGRPGTGVEGGAEKKFAPVAASLAPDSTPWQWASAAAEAAAARSRI
eukprot:SAG22_NODE_86_length_21440_cov_288.248700_2_plen_273_part_00